MWIILLDVILATTAFVATIIAIWGKTLKNSSVNIPFFKKLTKIGRFAICIAFITLLASISKSIITEQQNTKEKRHLFEQLETTENELLNTKNLIEESVELTEIISNVIGEIPKETDFSFIENLGRRRVIIPISSRTGQPIQMYGGDEFEYHIFGETRWYHDIDEFPINSLYLKVGNRTYPLFKFNDKIRVAAPIGIPMEIKLIWGPEDEYLREYLRRRDDSDSLLFYRIEEQMYRMSRASMKIIIHSTDQTRYREQILKLKTILNKNR